LLRAHIDERAVFKLAPMLESRQRGAQGMRMAVQEVFLIRHGETEWSLNGRHTGSSDIPLTENGRRVARQWRAYSGSRTFDLVLTSPLQRARETCKLAGLAEHAQIDADLTEWDYGAYEGLTPLEIRAKQPTWMIFKDGCPGGESPGQVGARVDRVIARIRAVSGNAAVFAHGHVLRVFGARWLGLPAADGSHFLLETATLCVLSSYHGQPAIKRWNAPLVAPSDQMKV
jgi:broad specificity phosphatase PhoE